MQFLVVLHLIELKYRVIYFSLSLIVCFLAALYYSEQLIFFYVKPLTSLIEMQGKHLIFTEMSEAFETYIHICLFTSLYSSFPLFFYHCWCFWIPSTYNYERSKSITCILIFGLLFISSSWFIYSVILPEIWLFFIHFEKKSLCFSIELEARIQSYINLTFQILLIFICIFQCPLYTHLALDMGILSAKLLEKSRRYIFVFFLALAALLSPPDVWSQLIISGLLVCIYEFCVFYSMVYSLILVAKTRNRSTL